MIRFMMVMVVCVMSIALVNGCASAPSAASKVEGNTGVPSAGAVSDDSNVAVMFINGMACPQCSYNVDLQLKKVAGVERVRVNMAIGRVDAWLSPTNPPTREELAKAVEQTTFTLVSLRMPGEPAAVR